MLSQVEAHRLAAALNQLRPDWPLASLSTWIRNNLTDRAYRDAAVALTWVACESETTSPARVLEAGPWWRATQAGAGTPPGTAPTATPGPSRPSAPPSSPNRPAPPSHDGRSPTDTRHPNRPTTSRQPVREPTHRRRDVLLPALLMVHAHGAHPASV
jgi:hypothetical protein